ncbi:hypothetical protein BJ875DRAFT_422201 [Amylocarpus encephaloides]|uniref:DUF676 domain-containing protein n=1 Tax=Amylocarpus encephaloides TaxID=45428 RepID=A0A9P7YKG1_9HELO|nr:hypothetical protein BJ875DRAFT_422201 [Amylocarpus encephaloides]
MAPIKFQPSQIGGRSVSSVPHVSYTGNPFTLLFHDVFSALYNAKHIPFIFLPLSPTHGGALCELSWTRVNLWAVFLHVVLVLLQVPFLLSIPFLLAFPVWVVALGVAAFMVVNNFVCCFLDGSKKEFLSNTDYMIGRVACPQERWVFMNGVAAGEHWLQSNIDQLSLTFGRSVIGLHNKTNGIVFDVLQILIQRNFNYATTDIRKHFAVMKSLLYDTGLSKVVFIMHSQGAVEGGMIVDWLLQEVPQDLLAKLEIYTFGAAANHFNNPHKHLRTLENALKGRRRGTSGRPEAGKAIHHIEHYTHTKEFVARWGVLHFINDDGGLGDQSEVSRFMGRVFQREARGHMFGMHYLDNMFPLEKTEDGKGGIGNSGFLGADEKNNLFMEEPIQLVGTTRLKKSATEDLATSARSVEPHGGVTDEGSDDEGDVGVFDASPISTRNSFHDGLPNRVEMEYKVKDLSRLWLYRNGKSPEHDEVDARISRIGTV